MVARGNTRERMIESGVTLVRRNGYQATSFRDVWTHAQTPRGSVYFYFPDGKEELGLAVVHQHSHAWLTLIRACARQATDPAQFIETLTLGVAQDLERHGFELGCAVQAVAVEMSAESESLRESTAGCYASWVEAVAEELRRLGLPADRAEPLAMTAVASVSGAIPIARSMRSSEPLRRVGAVLAQLAAGPRH